MKTFHEKTGDAARGKWRGIMQALGVPAACLKDKHGPCPMCGGVDRFRFDDQDRRGSYFCSQCGAGDGIKFAMEITGQSFKDACDQIDAIVGNLKPDAGRPKTEITDDQRRKWLREAWVNSKPVGENDLARRYLESRGIDEVVYPKGLRFHPAMNDGEGGIRPAMLGIVVDAEGHPVTIHRTFLRPDGLAKAEMAAPRKLMPGEVPDGACVRLSDWHGNGIVGIAEGIETALSACLLHGLPVWAAINTKIMEKWTPPEGAREVVVFGDNDAKFGGHAAAYTLAHRLAVKNITVSVRIPDRSGTDWNDVLKNTSRLEAAE